MIYDCLEFQILTDIEAPNHSPSGGGVTI